MQHRADLEDDEYAIERLPRGTYYPVEKLLFRNWNGKKFMVRWKGFRPGRKGQGGDDEWATRANLMQDIPQMVLAFERACRFDPMEPPPPVQCRCGDRAETRGDADGGAEAAGVGAGVSEERRGDADGGVEAAVAEVLADGEARVGEDEWDTVTTRSAPLSWAALAEEGVWVDPDDQHRTPPMV